MSAKRSLLLFFSLLLSGCGLAGGAGTEATPPTLPAPTVRTLQAPDPEDTAREFLDAWQDEEYAAMYALLTPLTQDGLTQEQFISRYREIGQLAAITGIRYQLVSSLLNPNSAQVRYRVTLESAAVGDIIRETWLEMTRVDEQWRVAWTESTILPELDGSTGLQLNLVTPPRANIYDREGRALATTGEIVALWLVPNQVGDEEDESAMLSALSEILDRHPEAIQRDYDDIRDTDWWVPLGEVSLEEFQTVSGTLADAGGVQWATYTGRFYLDNGLAPHSVGYVGQIQEEQLEDYLKRGYLQDAFVGQIGIEAIFEQELRGEPGGKLFLTDAEGNPIDIVAEREFTPPFAVYTNLNRELQQDVRDAIAGFSGAAVVLERDTGAVLAMASSPDFDPNLFDWHNPNSSGGLQEIFEQDQPLVNRVTTGVYPLGSLFKVISMSTALESGLFEPGTIYNCGHVWERLGVPLYDWTYEDGLPAQGEISLTQGLARSCNPYFYEIGWTLFNNDLPGALSEMAAGFGLGQETGIEIDEVAGRVPGPENSSGTWAIRNTVGLAIGQDELQATPLQAARYVAAVGNGGTLYRPQLVNRLENAVGDSRQLFTPEAQGTLPLSGEHLAAIQEAMVFVVRGDKGTARRRFLGLNLNIAGKTGTAQTGDEFTEPHSWFGAYTFEERENTPDIAVVVVLEGQGEGSQWAAPVARRIIESHFFGRPITLYPWESQIGLERTATPSPEDEGEAPEATNTPQPSG